MENLINSVRNSDKRDYIFQVSSIKKRDFPVFRQLHLEIGKLNIGKGTIKERTEPTDREELHQAVIKMPTKTPGASGSKKKPDEMSKTTVKSLNKAETFVNSAKTGSNPAKTSKSFDVTLKEAYSPGKKRYDNAESLKKALAPIQNVLNKLETTEELKDYWKQGNGDRKYLERNQASYKTDKIDEDSDSNADKENGTSFKSTSQASRSIVVPRRKFKNSTEPVIQSYGQLTKEFIADLIPKIQSSVIRECADRIVDDHSSYEHVLQLVNKSAFPLSKRSKAAHSKVQSFFIEAFQLIHKMENIWRIDGSKFGDDRKHVAKILDSNPELRIKMSEISHEKLESLIDECWRSAMNLEKGEPVTRKMSGFVALLESLEVYDGVAATVEKLQKEFPNALGCSETLVIALESMSSKLSGLKLNEMPKVAKNPPATPSESSSPGSPEPTESLVASNESKEPVAPEKPTSAPSTSKTEKTTCSTCNGRDTLLKKVLENIEKAETKAAHFENDAKKTDATEVVIRDLKKKMEEMEKVKKEAQNAIESRKKDVERIGMEGKQLKEKKKKLEGDLKKKQQKTHELQEQNTTLMKEIKTMKVQIDRMPKERSSAPAEASQQPSTVESSTNIRLLTADPKMWAFMEYEIFHFNSTCQIYLEVIEMNIQKIKKTSRTSDLLPLPPYPEITEQFKIALKQLEALPKEPSHHEASNDPERNCYICKDDFENGDQVLICKTCKKPVHRSCWMKWLAKQQIKTEDQKCGLCRGPMMVRKPM
ncbi:hypothetical protein CAEBREN_03451 [Caenorhabditis brenneri]|uniref:RING-type domain-containing protein n=1 Tax=Caenorhabditis brenneri TaxID=135651 RepID=G0PIH3_CAEBE|nr:hypothetical protein CAEBREN_03451 [Caenorhabditis brenneri]